jgi:hypothetical protein
MVYDNNNSQNYKKKIYIFFTKSPQNDELLTSPTQTTSNFIMLALKIYSLDQNDDDKAYIR